ncbi:MAG: hypothetical protein M3Q98_08060 [Actinomycetota bacterium]|nr:hypothetical protein [Actinomycetota bacterium]
MTDFPEALVAELAKKSGLVWVTYDGHPHPVWHEWVGDAVCVVANGGEQPLPGIEAQTTVTLVLRSKANRHLIAEAQATAEVLTPASEHWEVVTSALRTGRLNLKDRDDAIERWTHNSQVVRLVPTGAVTQAIDVPSAIGQSVPHLAQR